MSEDERKNGHNNKQKLKSKEEKEEYKLEQLLSQMIGKEPRTPRFLVTDESASRSTDLHPLRHKHIYTDQGKTGLDLLSGAIDAENLPSVAVQVNQNKLQSSNLSLASKKVATGKNKGIVIEEVVPKRKRPSYKNLEKLKKGDIADSEFDATSDDDSDEFDNDYQPEGKVRRW